jgi:hypothetical protein
MRIEPSGALQLVAQPQAGGLYVFRAPKAHANVTIRSDIDGKALELSVVEPKDLKNAHLYSPDRILENQSQYMIVMVNYGDVALCNQNALTKAKSLTPDVCKVTANLDDDPDGDSNRWQLAEMTGLKFGTCKFEVTLPELGGGKGIVLTGEAKVGRTQYPGEGSAYVPVPTPRAHASLAKSIGWLHVPKAVLGLAVWIGARLLRRRRAAH